MCLTGTPCPAFACFQDLACFFQLLAGERQQGNVPGLFHCLGHNTLVFCAGAGLAAWADVALFGNILSEKVGLFVVNGQGLICTKLTKFGLGKEAAVAA